MAIDPMPIGVVIKKVEDDHHGEVWSVEPKNEKENDDRIKLHRKKILGRWHDRHGKPFDIDHHKPIVFFEGETLEFTCEGGFQFAIGVKKNPDVDEFPGTPDHPFVDWKGFRIVAEKGSESAVVIRTENLPGPKFQAFYKFHGWVRTAPDVFEPVDPDGYCGS